MISLEGLLFSQGKRRSSVSGGEEMQGGAAGWSGGRGAAIGMYCMREE